MQRMRYQGTYGDRIFQSKIKFKFDKASKEIGMFSDDAVVNCSVYNLLPEKLGDPYFGVLCLPLKFELAMKDTFGMSVLNNVTQNR